jgi:hypothetical protein
MTVSISGKTQGVVQLADGDQSEEFFHARVEDPSSSWASGPKA